MNKMIWCETNEEVQVALTQLEKQGYLWITGLKPTSRHMNEMGITLHLKSDKTLTMSHYRVEGAVDASKLYKNLLR